jgi:dipeptidyl aminopeptidase/acylaminoacyl peptidase
MKFCHLGLMRRKLMTVLLLLAFCVGVNSGSDGVTPSGTVLVRPGIGRPPEKSKGLPSGSPAATEGKRLMTERDSIGMNLIAGPFSDRSYANALTRDFASFSPDGGKFVLLLKRGNLENNTNEYSMLLFQTDEIPKGMPPKTLVTMAASSPREAINSVAWLSDNDTILFLGEKPGETAQLYSVECSSGTVEKITSHPTNLVSYSSDREGREIVYAAEKPAKSLLTDNVRKHGFVVHDEKMADLIAGEITDIDDDVDLYLLKPGTSSGRTLVVPPALAGGLGRLPDFSVSPDGRYLIAKLNLTNLPESWHQYKGEALLGQVLSHKLAKGAASWVFRYGLIDLETGEGHVLLDAPVGYHGSEVAWSPDSTSVILTGVYLPLVDPDQAKPSVASGTTFVVEVDLKSLQYSKIANQNLKFIAWNQQTSVVTFEKRRPEISSDAASYQSYHKYQGAWKQTADNLSPEVLSHPEIVVEQSLNDPPKIVARNAKTGKRFALLDPNPQFAQIQFGKVEDIEFTIRDGSKVHTGLYFPPDFVSSKKYPLVVQTHGFDPNSFWIDGSFTTAFAAQALAAKGFLVLQVPDLHKWDETPEEAPNMSDVLERAIAFVEKRGILDRGRVGIIGFSRTGLYVNYMITHEGTHFAAAVVADGSDAGYSSYVQFLNAAPYTASDSESIIGGLPWGPAISLWLERSPEFRLAKVETPLLIQPLSPYTLTCHWATYAALRRLGKPVEMLYLPKATHILQQPGVRMASQQGDVDWFCFWLKNEEDPDPAKAAQYARWRELRKLQAVNGEQKESSPN